MEGGFQGQALGYLEDEAGTESQSPPILRPPRINPLGKGRMTRLYLALLASSMVVAVSLGENMRMCVPPDDFKSCQEMMELGKTVGIEFTCVSGTDRIDCMDKIVGPFMFYKRPPEADFMMVDPEDMFVSLLKDNTSYSIFKQIRSREEPEAPFRYESVAVVHKDLPVTKLEDLKGLKSCHTGIRRNAGYRIPYTVLTNSGVMKVENDPNSSVLENELKTWSNFFSKSCIVGKWSSHPEINRQLKIKYESLCQLCEHPRQCDYPDNKSGYDGALRCITEGDGQIAFTKVIAVKKFFGMAIGKKAPTGSAHDASNYVYLCPDGTKKPLDGPACPWAARPWQGFLTRTDVVSGKDFEKFSNDLDRLSTLGENEKNNWRQRVLGIAPENILMNMEPTTPLNYLTKARYQDVLAHRVEHPQSTVTVCEVVPGFFGKCNDLASSAFSRGIRPKIHCIRESSEEDCAKTVAAGKADIFFADAHDASSAIKDHNLKPLVTEIYPNNGTVQYLVTIVKKDSPIQSLKDLENKRICFWTTRKAEYNVALKVLVKEGLLNEKECPYESRDFALGTFGSQTCMTDPSATVNGKPLFDDAIMRPYVPGLGRDYSRYHPEDSFELLCKGTPSRRPLTDVEECNYGVVPPRMVLAKSSISDSRKEEIVSMLVRIGDLYNEHPEYIRLFGDLHGEPDVLVSNTAIGFAPVKDVVPSLEKYSEMLKKLGNCNLSKDMED